MNKTLNKTIIEQITTLRDRGMTIRSIAKELSISTKTVQKYAKPNPTIDNENLILNLNKNGLSLSGISAITNIDIADIKNTIKENPERRIIKEEPEEDILESIYKRFYKNDLSSCILIAHEVHSKYPKLKYDPASILALQKKYLTPTGNGEWETYIDCQTNEDIDHLLGGARALF